MQRRRSRGWTKAMALGGIIMLSVACFTTGFADERLPAGILFYVATNGNDQWSGKLPAPNDAKTDGPFASITKARDAIRKLKADGELPAPVTVQIRGGKYYLSETITFGPQDSGVPDKPISYVAYPGEKPELIGGKRIAGLKPSQGNVLSVAIPEAREGDWQFRQLFVDGERQIRARYPNFDPTDPYRKGFLYADKDIGGFGLAVGNIHNRGDWMDYRVQIPADGEYRFWMYYAALNEPHGTTDMAGRTVVIVDEGEPVPLMDLPDTGGWGRMKWSACATLRLTKGEHKLRWQNIKGGGLTFDAYALTNDPDWKPETTKLPQPAPGRHLVVVQAEEFLTFKGKQLSVSGTGGSKTAFRYRDGDFKPEWTQAPGAEIHIFQSGSCRAFMEIVSIEGVDTGTRTVTVGGKECVAGLRAGDRYFVENVFEELDSPGEWYLNTATGVLYYWPKQGFSQDSEVIAPVVGRVMEFVGDAANDKPVSHIKLAGLTIRNTDYSPDDGCVGYGMGNDGVVYLKDATRCAIEDCAFRNIGKYAICITGGGDNLVGANEIAHSAEGGVLLLGSARNAVSDNHIHDCGAIYKHIGGVVLQGKGTDGNVVSHNLIHDMSRYGITLKNAGGRNVIEYNAVHNTNTETYDTGGIEVTQHDKEFRSGSIIRNNVVGDTIGYSSKGEQPVFLSWGIYLDSYAGGYTVTNNITFRNSHGGIMLQGGKDNIIVNNTFVDSTLRQMHIANFASNSTGQVLERNIFYYTDAEAFLIGGGSVNQDVIRVDSNLYFCAGGDELRVGVRGIASFEDWRKKGFDANSTIADPLFVDPENDNYALQPNSPAFALGFRPIDTSTIGPRERR